MKNKYRQFPSVEKETIFENVNFYAKPSFYLKIAWNICLLYVIVSAVHTCDLFIYLFVKLVRYWCLTYGFLPN